MKRVLWWGRFDPEYSRNRILRAMFRDLGWEITDFYPRFSQVAAWEARLRGVKKPDMVWVPCFRQRDLAHAARWAASHDVPLVFDPLISAYDKQVLEREKLRPDSFRARLLQGWERKLFNMADIVIADTSEHARFFSKTFGLANDKLAVIPVGAEEALFNPGVMPLPKECDMPEVLFFGSFIHLQGPQVIARAARIYDGPPVKWHFVGSGPLLPECETIAGELPSVVFTPWVDYEKLPALIRRADLVLGIFGTTAKAGRVIPNKVYQAMACGRPLITSRSQAYDPAMVSDVASGIRWVDAGDAVGLAAAVSELLGNPEDLPAMGSAAYATYRQFLSADHVRLALSTTLSRIGLG